ncbi:MAG: hypothetical protein DRI48_03290 [Chloroflexi bacterium]|nr:MAG: hypothetical protein DRI48_03290 [Chloroflexota bacterium]
MVTPRRKLVWETLTAMLMLTVAISACSEGRAPLASVSVIIEATASALPAEEQTSKLAPPTPTKPDPLRHSPPSAEAPIPSAVERLPISISPDALTLPAGASGRYYILSLPDWDSNTSPGWHVHGLPPDVTAQFLTEWGAPTEGPLQIDTSGSTPEGVYTLEVSATGPDKVWATRVTLEISRCRESVEDGSFIRSIAEHVITRTRGGPSTLSYGIASPVLLFCDAETTRRLNVIVESAASATGAPVDGSPHFVLYRLLEWPPDTTNIGGYVSNVTPVAASSEGILTWEISAGAYLLYFDQTEFIETESVSPWIPHPQASVTYWLDIE